MQMQNADGVFQSKYKIEMLSSPTGFRVWGEGRGEATVILEPYGFSVSKNYTENYKTKSKHDLFQFRAILRDIVDELMRNWKSPKSPEMNPVIRVNHAREGKILEWAKSKTGKALAKRVKAEWLKCLTKIDPNILSVQRSVFAASGPKAILSGILQCPELYQNEYLMKDIINFRACALAVPRLEFFSNGEVAWKFGLYDEVNENGQWCVKDWRLLYSKTPELNGSLRKILTKLPGQIPSWMISKFRTVEFERPIYNRLELLSLISAYPRHHNVFMHATHKELRQALTKYASHMRIKPNFRKSGWISEAVTWISDFPDAHNGRVNGLAEKSIEWHRTNTFKQYYGKYTLDTPTKLPPIEFPANPNVHFLKTVKEIVELGQDQKHCVASYADQCVEGRSFLFWVEHKKEIATVEVGPDGFVRQSRGHRNATNAASRWAKDYLSRWGKPLQAMSGTANRIDLPIAAGYNEPNEDNFAMPF